MRYRKKLPPRGLLSFPDGHAKDRPSDPNPEPRLLYSRREAARMLSISVRNLDYRIARKEIETRRIGGKVLIPRAELIRFARSNHHENTAIAA